MAKTTSGIVANFSGKVNQHDASESKKSNLVLKGIVS
jgi:hypothetical protein